MTSPNLCDILSTAEQLHAAGQLDQAATLYRQALSINPGLSRTAYNLGLILLEQQHYVAAASAFKSCLATEPNLLEARLNLAFAQQEQGHTAEAADLYRSILIDHPFCATARFNLACLLLLHGNLPDGLHDYELRFSTNEPVMTRHTGIPLWDGSRKPGLRLLIHAEQGYGDTIQMLRYLPLLADDGLEVVLEVPAPLYNLCCQINTIHCVQRGTPLPDVDYRLPIMSLPRIGKTTLATIPAAVPYLTPEGSLVHLWKQKLAATGKLRIGLAWAGRMDLPVNRKRSCPPDLIRLLLDHDHIDFISLQQQPAEGFELQDTRLQDLTTQLTDFHQTAALIANLDLVISIDTAVAHLAGALGVPTWLLLPAVPDWRWLLERNDSPWYPTMRIFRQPEPEDWSAVISTVHQALTQHGTILIRPASTRGSAAAWYRLGCRNLQRKQPDRAADCFRQALAREPLMGPAWHNLGIACQRLNQLSEALSCYRRALLCLPDDPCSLNNLGVVQRELGLLEESRHTFERLLTARPDDGDGHWNRALTLLTGGEYREGWQEYEWRFRRTRPVPVVDPGTPRWQGEPLEHKTILLCCEQGYGDNIQFIRFASLLADWGATVLVNCPDRSLAGLLEQAPGVSRSVTPGQPLPPHDCWSPLLSLPLHLQITPQNLPACPYLFATPGPAPDLSLEQRYKVGLVWSGRSTDPRRACPVDTFTPLAKLRDRIAFYVIQQNRADNEIIWLQAQLEATDLSAHLHDFQATARIMQQLDLVISIDSAPAHLAGGLGLECWLLACAAPDWRWGLNGQQTPWYPTIRIFRQDRAASWETVIRDVGQALLERTTSRGYSNGIRCSTLDQLLARGDLQRESENWSHALRFYQAAIEQFPHEPLPLLCAGGCLLFLNRPAEAVTFFRQAIDLAPQLPEAHINLGLALLCCNEHPEGLKEFEWRRHAITAPLPPIPELPEITPALRLDGKTVLIHSEQGFGDLLQFTRYLPHLAAVGARIVMTVPQPMTRLLSSLEAVEQVIPHGEPLPPTDFQLPLLSLALKLLPQLPDIPAPTAYLNVDPALADRWRSRLSSDDRFRVGLVWRGSDLGRSGYRRSLTTEQLAPLTRLPGLSCYSLQLGASPEELALVPGIIDLTPEIADFADTAAIMTRLDLVISVDTAAAHLAGALGVRCWVPLLFSPDWRWYPLEQQASRWYPSLIPFRQPKPGDWQTVIAQIPSALQGELLIQEGHRLGREGRRDDAISCFRKAAALPGSSAAALLNLGIYVRAAGKPIEAQKVLQQAIQTEPDYPEAWQNLGMLQQDLGNLPEAYICLQQALRLRPDYETARWNLGLLQLLLGEYKEGFRNFESRFTKIGAVARLHTEIPAWDGSPPAGKTILIHAEQGYGDTIQFVRFIPLLADQGANIILEVQDHSLLELCGSVNGAHLVVVRGEPLPAVDCQSPLLSLPHRLGTTIQTIPRKVPYLSADIQKVETWRARLPQDGQRKIGICWKGRATPDPRRSIPFEQLASLLALPDIQWVSLQFPADQAARLPDSMLDPTGEITDFSDTAALISNLDLVICIDSAVAHLAGALGVPGMIMLPFAPDWRWGIAETIAPWYPTLQLIRQEQPGNWDTITEQLVRHLRKQL